MGVARGLSSIEPSMPRAAAGTQVMGQFIYPGTRVMVIFARMWKYVSRSVFTARRFASAVLAMAIPSVRPSVRHTPVLCQNDGT